MKIGEKMTALSVDRPGLVAGLAALSVVLFGLAAALPSLWPQAFPFLYPVHVDTDPENMLPHDEPVRVFHDRMPSSSRAWPSASAPGARNWLRTIRPIRPSRSALPVRDWNEKVET